MALRNIRINGDEILRKRSKEVAVVDDRIRVLLDDMVETMYDEDGVGLAAPQIGILKRVIVVDVDGENLYKMVNPEITEFSGEELDNEGCLSVPDIRGMVKRPQKLTVVYTDENGEEKTLVAEDLLARCVCHEIDHLDGVLFIDKIEEEQE